MNKETARYRRALKQYLRCGITDRKRLLSRFDDSLFIFQEDCPTPTYEQLEEAFGPPMEMADILMETIPEAKQMNYLKKKHIFRILAGITAALFVAFTIYVFCLQEFTIVSIEHEIIPTPTIELQDGDIS